MEEFLDTLSSKQAQKVTWTLALVQELEVVPAHYFCKMVHTEELWEVRVKMGTNAFRLLGFPFGSRLVVLTHAFRKKTQKTPRRAIELAEKRKRDYLRRHRHE